LPADLILDTPPAPDVAAYRAIYRRVGENLLWTSRALMSDAVLSEWLNRPTTRVHLLRRGGEAVGLVELDLSEPETAEIVSFGVIPEEVGTGTAHLLMNAVVADLVASGATRIWLHTCTFDHPAAVPFYRRHGFQAYKFAVEVFDDPRLTGHLPRSAAPQVPLIDRQK
jgi:GNAT superfamily N-acetyltransferase